MRPILTLGLLVWGTVAASAQAQDLKIFAWLAGTWE